MDIKEYKRSFVLKRLLKLNLSSFNGISIYDMNYKELCKTLNFINREVC